MSLFRRASVTAASFFLFFFFLHLDLFKALIFHLFNFVKSLHFQFFSNFHKANLTWHLETVWHVSQVTLRAQPRLRSVSRQLLKGNAAGGRVGNLRTCVFIHVPALFLYPSLDLISSSALNCRIWVQHQNMGSAGSGGVIGVFLTYSLRAL